MFALPPFQVPCKSDYQHKEEQQVVEHHRVGAGRVHVLFPDWNMETRVWTSGSRLPTPFRFMVWPFIFHVGIPKISKNSADKEADGNDPEIGDEKIP